MPLRSATVFVDDYAGSDSRLGRAIALAAGTGMHLDAVALIEEPPFNYVAGAEMAVSAWAEQVNMTREQAAAVAEAARAAASAAGVGIDARAETGVIGALSDLAAVQARYSDIAILAQPAPGSDGERAHGEILDGCLFASGRPVLILPGEETAAPDFSRVMIAWDAGRAATRAVNDALAILSAAEAVSISLVDPSTSSGRYGDEPGADIARHLARHGVSLELDRLPAMGRSVSDTLLAHAADMGAGLIVMGGYGHSKLREQVFGGVTRDMLRASAVPLLMSH